MDKVVRRSLVQRWHNCRYPNESLVHMLLCGVIAYGNFLMFADDLLTPRNEMLPWQLPAGK